MVVPFILFFFATAEETRATPTVFLSRNQNVAYRKSPHTITPFDLTPTPLIFKMVTDESFLFGMQAALALLITLHDNNRVLILSSWPFLFFANLQKCSCNSK